MKHHSANSINERKIHSLFLENPDELADLKQYSEFICFLVENENVIDVEKYSLFLEKLLDCGMIYLCTWGTNCELLHDITDEILADPSGKWYDYDDENLIMTTWHAKESLEEALWFSLYSAFPSEGFSDTANDFVAITIQDVSSYNKIVDYLDNSGILEEKLGF